MFCLHHFSSCREIFHFLIILTPNSTNFNIFFIQIVAMETPLPNIYIDKW